MSSLIRRSGPFAHRNARLFVLFRVLYNARAYYPILAIFFTDLGLTLDQFVMLNFIWAGAIFLLEVPSGAFADTLGRKRLLVISAVIMVVEMGILLFAPANGGWLLIFLCGLNRFLSGASEAAASGADEAIAYDALPEEDRESGWDDVMATTMRWQAAGFLIAMSLGGLLYDPSWLQKISPALAIDEAIAHRLPIALVFLQAIACLVITLRLEEKGHDEEADTTDRCRSAFRLTLQTARYAFTTRKIAMVLVGALMIDAVIRNFATINSEYYRLIDLPEWSFGFIGSVIAIGNWFVPGIAKRVNHRFETMTVLAIAGGVTIASLALLAPAWPWIGLLPAMLTLCLLGFVGFTVSRFLHSVADSSQRATLLSVKGLAFNLGYGLWSLAFSLLLAGLRDGPDGDAAFRSALWWQVGIVAALIIPFFAWAKRRGHQDR
ncbi:MFS transporter [Haloferula sp. A504]|uniref:MFS transporter n=1 Tax=Haloferula sp. A504 TaxID=3373601 RepID=UPI0031C18E9D|nr:MFS transporter [Verrucomicrobiaceae bacterium E54]